MIEVSWRHIRPPWCLWRWFVECVVLGFVRGVRYRHFALGRKCEADFHRKAGFDIRVFGFVQQKSSAQAIHAPEGEACAFLDIGARIGLGAFLFGGDACRG